MGQYKLHPSDEVMSRIDIKSVYVALGIEPKRIVEFVKFSPSTMLYLRERLEESNSTNRIYLNQSEYIVEFQSATLMGCEFPAFGKKGCLIPLSENPWIGFYPSGKAAAWNEERIKEVSVKNTWFNRVWYGVKR